MCFGTGKSQEQGTQDANQAADRATRDKYAGQADKAFSYFTGPDPTQTGLYKTLNVGGVQATNAAYDNAKAANALHSRVAGFGYEQPLTQAADTGIEIGRANQLSDVPRTSLLSTIGPELQAAAGEAGIGQQYNQGGIAAGNDATSIERQRLANQASLFSSLMKGVTGIASGFIPGFKPSGGGGGSGSETVTMDQLNSGNY